MERYEMRNHRFPLDDATADRLMAGEVHPSDAPPGYAGVARILIEARSGLAATEIDAALLGSLVRAIQTSPDNVRTPSMFSKLLTAKVGTVAAALVFSTAGAAAAAGGHLPAQAQDTVSKAAAHVGFTLPASGDDHATGNADNPTDSDSHGTDVSNTARSTDASGADKGAAVSEVARAAHGPDATTATDDNEGTDNEATDEATDNEADDTAEQGKPVEPGSQAPVSTPNAGGTGTAGDASGGKSDVGTAHAPAQAANGSANAGSHPTADNNPGTAHRG
jgi:hypothetical protein